MSDNDILKMTKKQIKELEEELCDLSGRVQASDKLVMKIKDKKLKKTYQNQILEMVDMYYILESILQKYPEDYIGYLKRMSGDPLEFIKRKLEKNTK